MNGRQRILGLDVGNARIGVAISDPLGITAAGIQTVERRNMRTDITSIADLAKRHGASEIVVGLPLNMDGSTGSQALSVQSFARKLARATGLPVIYEDERLTTVSAIRTLTLQGVRTGENRGLVDQQAAAVILQKHLDRRGPPHSA